MNIQSLIKELEQLTNKRISLVEEIKLPIEVGDIILRGKFRNKKVVVKKIGEDEHGSPTVNGKSILSIRLTDEKEEKS